MKFKINTEVLLKNATGLLKAVPSKTALPILENFLIEIKKGMIRITSSDGEVTIRSLVPTLEADETGTNQAVVPAKILTELLKTLPSGDADFQLEDNGTMTVSWETGKSTIPTFEVSDYPKPTVPKKDAARLTTTQQTLQDAMAKTAFAASDDDSRGAALTGVLIESDSNGTNIVGTDSHKLLIYEIAEIKSDTPVKALIPKKAALMLKQLLEKEGDVTIISEDKNARFQFGNTEFVTRVLEAKYPNYKAVIPKDNPNILSISRTELLSTLKRVAVCSDRASMTLKVELKYNDIKISAQDLAFSVAAHENRECEYDGDDMLIGFKAPTFIEVLASMESSNIRLHFKSTKHAMLITAEPEEEHTEPIKAIVMPNLIK